MIKSIVQIVDVGLGNIASIKRMIDKIGGKAVLVTKPTQLDQQSKIILPGVGHFDTGMIRLRETGFASVLTDPSKIQFLRILGICLGMQLLCRGSEEGELAGLGLIDADVKKFCFPPESKLKIPHMGWNVVSKPFENPLMPASDEEQRFYFVHSYKVIPDDPTITIGIADYGGEFCAAFQKRNFFGVQFHPEKSHRFGMGLLRRFVEL